MQNLINQLGSTGNPFISDYVPDLLSGVNIVITPQYDSKGVHVAGRAYKRDKNGVGLLGISPLDAEGLTDYGYRSAGYEYIESILHELIHFAGKNDRYTDRQVVLAIDAMGAIPDAYKGTFSRLSKDDVHGNSSLFDAILQLHCPGPEK